MSSQIFDTPPAYDGEEDDVVPPGPRLMMRPLPYEAPTEIDEDSDDDVGDDESVSSLDVTKPTNEVSYIYHEFSEIVLRPTHKTYHHLVKKFLKWYKKVLLITTEDHYTIYMMTSSGWRRTDATKAKVFWNEVSVSGTGKTTTNGQKLRLATFLETEAVRLSITPYAACVFKPRDHDLHPKEFNKWTEFVAHPEGDPADFVVDMRAVRKINKFIKNIICNGETDVYNWLMGWFAQIIQEPWNKTETVPLFQSKQGTGKGTLVSWFRQHVIGQKHSHVCVGIGQFTQHFNHYLEDKIFVEVSELATTSNEFHSQFDIAKHLITDDTIPVTPKNVDSYNSPNRMNVMMTTNSMFGVKLEASDRRYCPIRVSTERMGDTRYWHTIHNRVLTATTAKHWYAWVLTNPSLRVNLRMIPETELKRTMMLSSMNPVETFIDAIKTGAVSLPTLYKGEERYVLDGALYSTFNTYCTKEGISSKLNGPRFRGLWADETETKITQILNEGLVVRRDGWEEEYNGKATRVRVWDLKFLA